MAFDVGAIVARLELNDKLWRQSIDRITKDNSLSGYVLRNQAAIQSLGKSFTIAGAGIVGAFGAMLKKATDWGDELDNLRQKTGISAETLSSFSLAIKKSGMDMGGFATSMKLLANNMADANSGSAQAQTKFTALGISFKNADGSLRPLDQVMLEVADRFKALPDGAQKSATAVDLFGRSGTDMIHMLNLGRDGLQAEMDKARELGLVMTNEAAAKCDDFSEKLDDLGGSLKGVAIQVGQAVMPVVQSFVTTLTGVITHVRAWAAENPGLAALLSKVALAVGALMMALGPVLIALPKLIQLKAGLKVILPGIADGLKNIKLTQVAASAAYGIAIGLVIQYAAKLIELKEAEKGVEAAQKRQWQTEDRVIDKLSEASVAAGWHFGKMSKLITAYDGNIAALEMAIKRGKEGADIQEALAKVSEKSRAAFDAQKKSTDSLAGAFEGAAGAALGKNKELDTQNKLEAKAIPQARQLAGVVEQAAGSFDSAWNALYDLNTVLSLAPDKFQDVEYAIQDLPPIAQVATETTRGYFDGLYNDIASGIGTAMQGLVAEIGKGLNFANMEFFKGGINFKATFDAIWTTVKQGFFRMVGEMITDWAMRGMKSLISSTASAATSVGQSATGIGTAFKGIGGIITGLATTIGTVITTLATAVGTGIVAIATAIGTAVVTLATSIAAAATALAAAAPALVVVGLIATGVYAATKLLGALIGGGGGKQTDVTYWLKPISERAQEIRDWLFINAQERLNFLSIQITDLKTTLIAHVGDRITALILQTGKQLQVLYQGTNPYLRVIAAESKWLSKIYGAIGLMIKALTSKHTIYVRDEILTAKMGEASQGIKQIVKPISGPLPFAPFGRPISGPVPHEFDIPNRPISGPVPHDDPKPKPKPKPIPVIGDDVTWLKRIHAQVANISNILVGVFTTPTFDTPNRPISGPIPGKTFGFGGPGGRGDINRASGTNITVQNNFYIKAIDSVDTERFINDKAGNIIVRRIQRAFKTRELHVPASAVGGS